MTDSHTILITGAASGIGRSAASLFADAGYQVALVDIDEAGLREVASAVDGAGGVAMTAVADLSSPEQIRAAYGQVVKALDPPLFAFNNAGVEGERLPFGAYPDADFERTMQVNLSAVWHCMKAELPAMIEAGRGSIVNTASALGLVGAPAQPAYTASKHAVVGLTKAVALDHIGDGVRVNCICPGLVATPMVTERALAPHPELEELWLGAQPIGRFADPKEVARAALFLCSDDSSFITGHALPVDGGYVAR